MTVADHGNVGICSNQKRCISKKGKLFKDKAIKDLLAKDYKKYNKPILDLEMKISKEEIDEQN